ncbi:MAG: ERF family protein [Candidatus Riflebacteria bacterium]|nr:ERF family protein [Candidatus Riflebacteria bacterium]
MKTSENITEIASALAKAQELINPAAYDAANPHFRSRYATLASVMQSCRAALSKNQIAVVQGTTVSDKNVTVTTMLIHSSGQFISDDITIPVAQNTAQAIGSALTYGRRYGLSALVGIVSEEDDDSNSAMPIPSTEIQKDVKFTQPKSNPQTSNINNTPQTAKAEVKAVKQPKEVSERIQKIKQIFGLSAQIGHTPDEMKAVIGEIIGLDHPIKESQEIQNEQLDCIIENFNAILKEQRKEVA